MYHHGTRRYIDHLQDFVHGINNSVNRMIRQTPASVVTGKLVTHGAAKKNRLTKGTTVRISTDRATFQKGYEKGWSEEEFKITKVILGSPTTYRIEDFQGEAIDGIFYDYDLVPCENKEQLYRIERVIDKRTRKGRKQILVKWLGFTDAYNSWEDADNVVKIN